MIGFVVVFPVLRSTSTSDPNESENKTRVSASLNSAQENSPFVSHDLKSTSRIFVCSMKSTCTNVAVDVMKTSSVRRVGHSLRCLIGTGYSLQMVSTCTKSGSE